MPALQSFLIEPIWCQLSELIPKRRGTHPLVGHRPAIPDRVVFDKLVQVLVFGAAYERIADKTCSATTLRRRRDEWIKLGVMDELERKARHAYDTMIGLQLEDLVVDGIITKAPCGGEIAGPSPVDRRKQGIKRSNLVDERGIPLGTITAPANVNDSPLLGPTLDTVERLALPENVTVNLDRGYGHIVTEEKLDKRQMTGALAKRGGPMPRVRDGMRWVVERTNSWQNAFKKLVWCTERKKLVLDFYVAFANTVIIVRRLVREGWKRYRWEGRPRRCP